MCPLNPKTVLSLYLRALPTILIALVVAFAGCETPPATTPPSPPAANSTTVSNFGYEVVKVWPHDPGAFTQGLVFHDGKLLESTGQEGRSSLRRVKVETGQIEQKLEIPSPYFAEGITLLNGKIYQLTWQHQRGFIYDAATLQKIGEFPFFGEGWGIANDGKSLIISDGSSRLRFLDPNNFQVTRTLAVVDRKVPVQELNELEFVQGKIYANIWHQDRIAVIDPQTGSVTAWIDMSGLLAPGEVHDEEAVLNGIAYDESSQRLFVTGKLWPKLFEIRLKELTSAPKQ
jgi:glutamine cyclotransferase